jgi:hypothetical protein
LVQAGARPTAEPTPEEFGNRVRLDEEARRTSMSVVIDSEARSRSLSRSEITARRAMSVVRALLLGAPDLLWS